MKQISVSQMIGRANANLKNGKFVEAEQLFAEVLMSFPNNLKAQQGLRRLSRGRTPPFTGSPPQKLIDKLASFVNAEQLEIVIVQATNLLVYYPKAASLWNILGIASAQIARFDKAIEAFEQTIILTPMQPSAYFNLGNVLKDQGKLEEAIEAYSKALEIKPDYDAAYNNLTLLIVGEGISVGRQQHEAIAKYNGIMNVQSAYFDALFKDAVDLQKQGNLHKAIGLYSKIIEKSPEHAEAYCNMSVALTNLGKPADAVKALNRAIAINPEYAEAYYNLGNALVAQFDFASAINAYKKALSLDPFFSNAYFNLGNALTEVGDLGNAVKAYRKGLTIKPEFAEAYSNLGVALKDQGRLQEAIECYEQAISINPNFEAAYSNLGIALKDQGNIQASIESYRKAIAINPSYAEAYSNLSFQLLNTQDIGEGLKLREWRWKTENHQIYIRRFIAPLWDGKSSLKKKTLLVWGEQGPGDMVIWASCLNYFAPICEQLILECAPKLVEIFKHSFPLITVRPERTNSEKTREDYDYQVPMETLFAYSLSDNKIPQNQKQYLFPANRRVDYWREKLKSDENKSLIGLCWKSPVMNAKRANNYPDLSHWEKILKTPNCTFINLQSTDFTEDIKFFANEYGANVLHLQEINLYDDLFEVAALSRALDCVVSVATAAATISAAVGTPTFIPTWNQSSWNNVLFKSRGPKIEVFGKNTHENWSVVFEKIQDRISNLSRKKGYS